MDPFRLACPHCSSKIVVRHEQLLGQTLPCPKCKDPISVPTSPPAPADTANNPKPAATKPTSSQLASAPRAVGGQIIDSTAMTKVGDVDWNEILASDDPAARTDSSDSGPKFRSLNEPDFIPIPSTFTPISPRTSLAKQRCSQTTSNADSGNYRRHWLFSCSWLLCSLCADGWQQTPASRKRTGRKYSWSEKHRSRPHTSRTRQIRTDCSP